MAMLGAAALSASARRLAMAGRGAARGSLGFRPPLPPPPAAHSPARACGHSSWSDSDDSDSDDDDYHAYRRSSSFDDEYYRRSRSSSSSFDDDGFSGFFLFWVLMGSCMLMDGCGRSRAKGCRQRQEEEEGVPVAAPRKEEPETLLLMRP